MNASAQQFSFRLRRAKYKAGTEIPARCLLITSPLPSARSELTYPFVPVN